MGSQLLSRLSKKLPGVEFAQNTALVGIIQIAGAGLLFLMQVILARLLDDPSAYGTFGLGMSIVQFLSKLAVLGIPLAAMRLVSAAIARDQWARVREVERVSYKIVGVASSLVSLLGVAFLFFWYARYEGAVNSLALVAAIITVPVWALTGLTCELARSHGLFAIAFGPDRVFRPIVTVLAAYSLWWACGELSALQALVSVGFAVSAGLVIQVLAFRKLRTTLPDSKYSDENRRPSSELARVAVPLFFVSMLASFLTHADVLMLGALTSAEEVGNFYAASRLAMLVSLPLVIVNGGLAPVFARYFARGEVRLLQKAVTFASHAALWPTLVISIVAIVLSENLLGLFGEYYEGQKMLLKILLVGQVVSVFMGSVSVLLTVTGHEKKNAGVFSVVVGLNIAMNLFLIPRFGAQGAAVSTAVSLVLWNVWMYVLVRRKIGIYPSVLRVF